MSSPTPKRKVGQGSSPTASVASSDAESRVSRSSRASSQFFGSASSRQSSKSEQSQPTSVDSATSLVSKASEGGKLSELRLTIREKERLKGHKPMQGGKQLCLDFCSHAGCKKRKCPHIHSSLPPKVDYSVQLFLISKKGPKTGPPLTKAQSKTAQKTLRATKAEEVKLSGHIKNATALKIKPKHVKWFENVDFPSYLFPLPHPGKGDPRVTERARLIRIVNDEFSKLEKNGGLAEWTREHYPDSSRITGKVPSLDR